MKTTLKIIGRIKYEKYYQYRCIDKYDTMFFFYSRKELEYNSYISLEYKWKNVYIDSSTSFFVYKATVNKLYINKNNILVDSYGNAVKSTYPNCEIRKKDGKKVIYGEYYKI